jgi:hypothetical protein
MRVAFVDTNYDWHQRDNVMWQSLIRLRENVTLDNINPDLVVTKAFGNGSSHELYDCAKWFFTIESPCPTHPKLDFSFTHDEDSDTNSYFPCYYSWVDWFNEAMRVYPQFLIPPKLLTEQIPVRHPRRKSFTAFWTAGGPFRDVFPQKLEAMGFATERHGNLFGKPYVNSKMKWLIMLDTKYNLAFENRLYPGYHTEKVVEAKAAGTIPIYYGDLGMKNLNSEACLNIAQYDYLDEALDAVADLVHDEHVQRTITETPLFINPPTIDTVLAQVERGLLRVGL